MRPKKSMKHCGASQAFDVRYGDLSAIRKSVPGGGQRSTTTKLVPIGEDQQLYEAYTSNQGSPLMSC
ncbi:MAG: hypothetical protein ACLVJ6_10380 [Merdibacter sp.]